MDESVTTDKMIISINNCDKNCKQDGLCSQNFMETSQKNLIESTALIHKKQKFNGKRWHKLCIINNCEKQVQRDDLCCRHFTEKRRQQKVVGNIGVIHMNQKFNGCRWQRVCSGDNCDKYAVKNGLCRRHTPRDAKKPQSSAKSKRVRVNKNSTKNHTEHNAFDDLDDSQTIPPQQNFPTDSVSAQFESPPDSIATVAQSDISRCSMTCVSTDIRTDASERTADNEHSEMNMKKCQYQIPTNDDQKCHMPSTYQCSHCSSVFCLKHGAKHQEDVKEEINYLLDETQELIAEIPSLNIDSGRKNCEEQLNYWIRMMVNKLQQQYKEFQMELDRLHNYIEMNKNQWKSSLKDRMETQVRSILLVQLGLNEIDGSELTKARDELLRAQKLCDLLNSQAIITTSTAEDNEIDLFTPRLCFSNVIVDGFNWIYEILPKPNAEITKLDVALSKINNITTDPLVDKETIEDNHFGDSDTSPLVLSNTNQSMNSNNKQVDYSPIESTMNNTNNSNNLSTNIENQKSNSTSWLFQYHQNDLEQIITNPENHIELNLTSKNLNCSDMKIVSHYALQNNKTLIQLDLSRNQIKDIGACHLSIGLQLNQTLTILDLSHNQIGDTGISELSVGLKSNKILATLDLSANKIKDEGARFLSIMLRSNKALTTLNLSENDIKNKGATCLSTALQLNQTLLSLNLSNNRIGDQGGRHLCNALKSNQVKL
ncbi:unnamed protein product [Adineta steineri]|uniref:Uncharacterized protein n=1 Tax=Adineta steineri TaxID=433720 RepID=A0A814I3D6_9BILA|nr:unnamed protein product [Adineta steineri]CAF1267075.1 unnamed protein product [Adineta steineri]CAF1278710.1 unnamed protein product [Adineta steineri]